MTLSSEEIKLIYSDNHSSTIGWRHRLGSRNLKFHRNCYSGGTFGLIMPKQIMPSCYEGKVRLIVRVIFLAGQPKPYSGTV